MPFKHREGSKRDSGAVPYLGVTYLVVELHSGCDKARGPPECSGNTYSSGRLLYSNRPERR